MTPLTDRLKAALAFDEILARDHFHRRHPNCKRDSSPVEQDMIKARWENARLAPLHEKLLAVVAAAEVLRRALGDKAYYSAQLKFDEALQALRSQIDEK